MSRFYFCDTCNTVTTSAKMHSKAGHKTRFLKNMEEMIELGLVRDPILTASSTNVMPPMDIRGVSKSVVFIGKSGKQVKTRRECSRIAIKYRNHAEGESKDISEQDFYRLLIEDGLPELPDPSKFHTCCRSQCNSSLFLSKLITPAFSPYHFALVTINPDRKDCMLFTRCSGDRSLRPYAAYGCTYYSDECAANASVLQKERMRDINSYEKEFYYDLLAPRVCDDDGLPYLTRILITVVHNDEIISKYKLEESKQFVLYELSINELNGSKSGTSFDWASSIVQDARSILC